MRGLRSKAESGDFEERSLFRDAPERYAGYQAVLGSLKWLDMDAEAAEAAGLTRRDFSAKGRTGRLW